MPTDGRTLNRIPDNEFTEFCTGDMPSMDSTYHHWMQPRWDKERKAWLKQQEERDRASGKGNHVIPVR